MEKKLIVFAKRTNNSNEKLLERDRKGKNKTFAVIKIINSRNNRTREKNYHCFGQNE